MWQQDMGDKITYEEAMAKADTLSLGGYNDWRVPTIKELYSLICFQGISGGGVYVKYIDTIYFDQPFGDTTTGERIIDAQVWSKTIYKGLTFNGDSTVFGVNFIDGRIKGYPKYNPGTLVPREAYFRMVRGNESYGENDLIENNDSTVSDNATGLMWQKYNSGAGMDWQDALEYAENLSLAGYDDWRLPNTKELQSIVDYSRSPQETYSPAIDPIFSTTEIEDYLGNSGHYPYYWTSTTHHDGNNLYDATAYIAFGEADGYVNNTLYDVHGAGAQRSDPKTGNFGDYPTYFGPQGDIRIVFNYVRCVRNIDVCQDTLNTDETIINTSDSRTYRALETIILANGEDIFQIIGNGTDGGNVFAYAGSSIVLKQGFKINKGASFLAEITLDPCEEGSQGRIFNESGKINNETVLSVYPSPCSDVIEIQLFFHNSGCVQNKNFAKKSKIFLSSIATTFKSWSMNPQTKWALAQYHLLLG
jgi:hypothetical protein